MAKYSNHILIIFFTFIFILPLKGQNNIETLYKNRDYLTVIDSLTKKLETEELNHEEYYMLTRSYGRTKQYSNGLTFAKKMQDLALKTNDTFKIVQAINLATENFIDLNEIQEGLRYSKGMLSFFRQKDSIEYQKLCFKLGMLYYHNNDYQKAFETYNKITKPEYRQMHLFNNNYALTLLGIEKWDEAIFYLKKTLNSKHDNSTRLKNFSNIGFAYLSKEDYPNAKIYLDSAVYSLADKNSPSSLKKLYQHYFNYYRKQGELKQASKVLKDIEQLNQKLFKEQLKEKLQALEISYKRENTLQMTVKTIDNKLASAEKQKLWGAVIFLFIIIILLSILFFYKYKNIKAAHENTIIEQRLLRLQMDPHFIFNSLSVLQGMILNKEGIKAVKYVSKFSKLLRSILESSREKMVTLDEELKTLNSYINLQNIGRNKPLLYTLSVDKNVQPGKNLIPPMLIQPFIENAIEHGFTNDITNPEISIHITFEDKKLLCNIKDNGVGIDTKTKKSLKNKKSLATLITSERLDIISKQYNVASSVIIQDRSLQQEQGTQVLLTLPYTIKNS